MSLESSEMELQAIRIEELLIPNNKLSKVEADLEGPDLGTPGASVDA